MFAWCTSLVSYPDISKWEITKVKFMHDLFWNCTGLSYLPDLSNK